MWKFRQTLVMSKLFHPANLSLQSFWQPIKFSRIFVDLQSFIWMRNLELKSGIYPLWSKNLTNENAFQCIALVPTGSHIFFSFLLALAIYGWGIRGKLTWLITQRVQFWCFKLHCKYFQCKNFRCPCSHCSLTVILAGKNCKNSKTCISYNLKLCQKCSQMLASIFPLYIFAVYFTEKTYLLTRHMLHINPDILKSKLL